jgi:predicted nucleic acid-binding protein
MYLVPITRTVLERALSLRATYRIRTPDAIHAATALLAGCALFVTNDPVFRRIRQLPVAVLDDYV